MDNLDISPLQPKHLDDIKDSLQRIALAERQIAKAKQAGIDVATYEAQLADTKSKLLGIKNTYFPGQ